MYLQLSVVGTAGAYYRSYNRLWQRPSTTGDGLSHKRSNLHLIFFFLHFKVTVMGFFHIFI